MIGLRGRPPVRMSTHIDFRTPLVLVLAVAACDGGAAVMDASTPVASRAAQIALRVDVQPAAPASLSALAYRAAYSGISQREVLGLVDPLAGSGSSSRVPLPGAAGSVGGVKSMAQPTETGCVIRDLDRASTDLAAHGDSIELEELKGIAISAADATELLRLSPRLFPDIAASIGGVVSEGGPVGLSAFPGQVRVTEGASAGATVTSQADVVLPAPAWIRQVNGVASAAGLPVSMASDLQLVLTITGSAVTTVELRPLGATVALTCTVPVALLAQAQAQSQAEGGSVATTGSGGPTGVAEASPLAAEPTAGDTSFAMSRQLLARLVEAAGGVPGAPIAAALDVVRRAEQTLSPSRTEMAVEIRTSTLVELRP